MSYIHQMPAGALQGLIDSNIITLRGFSGIETTVEIAKQAAGLVRMHTPDDRIYDIVAYIPELDTFNIECV